MDYKHLSVYELAQKTEKALLQTRELLDKRCIPFASSAIHATLTCRLITLLDIMKLHGADVSEFEWIYNL